MNRPNIACLLLAGCLGAVGAVGQTANTAGSDSEREALKEAVRFERHKLAAARAQMLKEGRSTTPAPEAAQQPVAEKEAAKQPAAEKKAAPARTDNQALNDAVQFERHKIAAAQAQERRDAAETARAQAPKPQEPRRYSRR